MFFLGVNLGFKLETEYDREQPIAHDAAAALVDDHQIVAAVEEERLSERDAQRLRHPCWKNGCRNSSTRPA